MSNSRNFNLVRVSFIAIVSALAVTISGLNASLIHQYELNGTYSDELSGTSLVAGGADGVGTLNATNYSFGLNQGLSLSNALPDNAHYSILIDFSFPAFSGDDFDYKKIVDFKNLTGEAGVYYYPNNFVTFYNNTGYDGIDTFTPNVLLRLVLTRDSGSGIFSCYMNGAPQFSFLDTDSDTTFTGTNNIIQFFNDDIVSGFEASSGLVDRIEIYDTALTSGEVAALGGVPEPSILTLGFVGVMALLFGRRYLRGKQSVA